MSCRVLICAGSKTGLLKLDLKWKILKWASHNSMMYCDRYGLTIIFLEKHVVLLMLRMNLTARSLAPSIFRPI